MNKFKLLITNCKSKINSLFNRIQNKEIAHIIITTKGDKIKCIDSIELFSDETKFIVAKCVRKFKYQIITINNDNVAYILEKYDQDTWDKVLNITNVNEIDETCDDNRLYG